MFDFGGWLDNWSYGHREIPRGLLVVAAIAGLAGVALLAGSWLKIGFHASPWLLAPALAIGIDLVIAAIRDEDSALENASLGYGHALLLAGGVTLLATHIPALEARRAFVIIAPCLAIASGPLLKRGWAATLFARHMISHVHDQRERVRAALAGETKSLVVRVTGIDGDDAALVTLGASGERALRIDAKRISPYRAPNAGSHFLLEGAVLGEVHAADGYRDRGRMRRVESVDSVTSLGGDTEGLPPSVYADEVRAGVVAMAAHHIVLVLAALVLTAFCL